MTEIVLASHMTPLWINKEDIRNINSIGCLLPGFEYKVSYVDILKK
jgi:hypothetical protein